MKSANSLIEALIMVSVLWLMVQLLSESYVQRDIESSQLIFEQLSEGCDLLCWLDVEQP